MEGLLSMGLRRLVLIVILTFLFCFCFSIYKSCINVIELGDIIKEAKNKSDNRMIMKFTEALREKLQKRFPDFGTDRELHRFGNYMNPSLKGLHLKLLKIFNETKEELEEKLGEWKPEPEQRTMRM